MWANDHNDLIAVMLPAGLFLVQTTRQGVSPSSLFGFDANEKLITGPVCLIDFRNLCARAVCLPTMLRRKVTEEQHVQFSTFDAQPLLQMRQLLDACRTGTQDRGSVVSLQQAATLAASFSHSTLWRLLAKAALELEELEIAEEALVRSVTMTQTQPFCLGGQ
ncbi:hypothetical protein, conserved [Eimeria necatrix]|uniref:Uncharacterized protein n=1 Tax=Eimeria necatrix TaxID=51315 RepID=U6MZY5_9EIME|nr:hypothetical protein, conserved [Eimeria necatrix]CDJ68044.1 hypothetical protein, conserved [Eimeria necatrix]